jgi:RNase P subunit RPR2
MRKKKKLICKDCKEEVLLEDTYYQMFFCGNAVKGEVYCKNCGWQHGTPHYPSLKVD